MTRGFLFGGTILALTICFTGCSKSGSSQAGSEQNSPPTQAETAAVKEALTPDQEKAFSELPPAERAAAEKQAICPVSSEKLGSMGAPYKVTVTGGDGKEHVVYLCCDGCKDSIEGEPDKYLAKLQK